MSDDDSQLPIPPAFLALFMTPRAVKPSEPRAVIAARHELCEDMAQLLTERARELLWQLGVTEADVLERMHRGLAQDATVFSPAEAGWVTHRLAELLEWPQPVLPGEGPAGGEERLDTGTSARR
jgi:hypothetical protein